MFGIRWLNGSSIVAKETSALEDVPAVIENARSRAADVRRRHPGNEPDSFVVADDLGEELAHVVIEPPAEPI
jgi:hypothetical protein